jgi:hypothetical protein
MLFRKRKKNSGKTINEHLPKTKKLKMKKELLLDAPVRLDI